MLVHISNCCKDYSKNNKPNEALVAYKKVIKINPDHGDAYFTMGNALRKLDNHDDAICAYKKSTEFNSQHSSSAFYNIGTLFMLKNKYQDAVAVFQESVKLQPGHAGAHLNMGNAYTGLESWANAINSYNKAILTYNQMITDDSEDKILTDRDKAYLYKREALNKLGIKHYVTGEYNEAISCFNQILEESTDNIEILYNRGRSYQNNAQVENAIKDLKEVINGNSSHAKAHQYLGICYKDTGDIEKARKHLEKALLFDGKLKLANEYLQNIRAEAKEIKVEMSPVDLEVSHIQVAGGDQESNSECTFDQ